jgi:hypothetical protein
MADINRFIRSFILILGVTPPKPGQERRVAVILGVTLVIVTAITVALVLGLARVMYR